MVTKSRTPENSPPLIDGKNVIVTDTALQLRDRPWWKSLLGIVSYLYHLAVFLFLLLCLWGASYPLAVRILLALVLISFGVLMTVAPPSAMTLIELKDSMIFVRGKPFGRQGAVTFARGFGLAGFAIYAVDLRTPGRRKTVYGSLNPSTVRPLLDLVSRFQTLESGSQPGDWPPPPSQSQ